MQSKIRVIRAAKSTYIVFGAFWLVPFLGVAVGAVMRPGDRSAWQMLLMIAAYAVVLMMWVHRFRIELRDSAISYQSLFGGRKEVRVADIISAEIRVGYERSTDRFLPPIRMEVHARSATGGTEKLIVNLKVFSLEDVRALEEHLQRRRQRP